MREHEAEELARLEQELAAPVMSAAPEPAAPELAAVQAEARRRAADPAWTGQAGEAPGRRTGPRRFAGPALAWAGAIAAVLVVAAVAGTVLWRTPDSAFAAAKAAAALVPAHKALRIIETMKYSIDTTISSPDAEVAFSEVATAAARPLPASRIPTLTYDILLAPGGTASHTVVTTAKDGTELWETVSTSTDGRAREASFLNGYVALGFMSAKQAAEASRALGDRRYLALTDGPVYPKAPPAGNPANPTAPVSWWLDLRNDLDSGKAKVLGTEKVGGVDYWHVRSVDTTWAGSTVWELKRGKWVVNKEQSRPFPAGKRSIDALLRVGDYRPLWATVTYVTDMGPDGPWQGKSQLGRYRAGSTRYDVSEWKEIDPSTLPTDTFITASLPESEALTAQMYYYPGEIGDFKRFGVWGLRDGWAPPKAPADDLPELQSGTYMYTSEPALLQAGPPPAPNIKQTSVAPGSLATEGVLASWRAADWAVQISVVSLPHVSAIKAAAVVEKLRREGTTPVDVTVNGVHYRGAEGDDRGTGYSATVLGRSDSDTVLVTILAPWQRFDRTYIERILAGVERKSR